MKELLHANWMERFLFFLGRRRAFLVEGNSMSPTLKEGDTVLVNSHAKPEQNDLVLVNHPYKKSVKILKRLDAFNEKGDLILSGDNPSESTDSRTFGAVSIECLIGKVTCRLK